MCHPYPGVAAPAARLPAQVLLFVPRAARICARAFRARPAARCRKIQTRGFATVVERRSSKGDDETERLSVATRDTEAQRKTTNDRRSSLALLSGDWLSLCDSVAEFLFQEYAYCTPPKWYVLSKCRCPVF